jgi:redox-sensitive bicupin YhaK (pirin superfamily)
LKSVERSHPPSHKWFRPFIFFDAFGPAVLPPGDGVDVGPHIGLATLTYLIEGDVPM